jgi:DNA ligase-4
MTKAYRRRDRAWRECISLEEFQRIARETVGRERPNKEADDWCKNLFGKVASPGVKHPLRRKQREEAILADLEKVERNHRDGGHKSKDHNSKKRKRTPTPAIIPKIGAHVTASQPTWKM